MNIARLSALLTFAALISCQKKQQPETTTENMPAETIATHTYCYARVSRNMDAVTDSLYIHLEVKGDSVTGEMNWLPAEKDKMTGTLAGTIDENAVKAIYTYSAEGQTAKEEKLFKIDGDTLRIKNGELEEHNGVWILKNADAAPYNESVRRVNCPEK